MGPKGPPDRPLAAAAVQRSDDKVLEGALAGAYDEELSRTERVRGELRGENVATAAIRPAAWSSKAAVPEETPWASLGPPSVGSVGTDGAGAAAMPAASSARSGAGDCWPKCAVLGRENIESAEPDSALAMA